MKLKFKVLLLSFIAFFCILGTNARSHKSIPATPDNKQTELRYRLTLTDKAHSPYQINRPEAFLSEKSIERRKKFGLAIDTHDLPVSPEYLKRINDAGAKVFNVSKWNNTVLVSLTDSTDGTLARLRALPFVCESRLVYVAPDSIPTIDEKKRFEGVDNKLQHLSSPDSIYGLAQHQTNQLNIAKLHELGYRGQGMTIAVLDGGFRNVDTIFAFDKTKILGTRNFTRPGGNVFAEHSHGMMVLSCISPNVPHSIIGTAPEAQFYLLETEDTFFEYEGEEDNWCAALEYADSLGVDVVTSSLGYVRYETPIKKLRYHWLDGQHQLISKSASLAASRGILLCNSAGNEGDDSWKKIGFPADANDIITVGAVEADGTNTVFSSIGYTADGRIKPDVMALGGQACVLNTHGNQSHANGTSFSCPILAGAVTCLLQAHPTSCPQDIIEALHRAGNNAEHPDNIFGYGIPDMFKAHDILKNKP